MSEREGAFLRGDIGVDGISTVEEEDAAALERQKVLGEMLRGRTYLGREFLTWLLWRSNIGGPIVDFEDEPVGVLVVGKVVLRGLAGDATELSVKGGLSAYSEVVREAMSRGLLVHVARLRIQHGERAFEVTVDAEHLALRSAELPKVLSEEEDDQVSERLWLIERLEALVDALLASFLELRTTPKWEKRTVPQVREWLKS